MTHGIIDSSTLYELIHLFRERSLAETSAWSLRCSLEVTSALVHGRHLGIAQSPGLGQFPGSWGYLKQRLHDQTELVVPPARQQQRARQIVDGWSMSDEGLTTLREGIDSARFKDPTATASFYRYVENMVVHTWPSLIGPHEIFEKRHIPAISRVIGQSELDLERIYRQTKNERFIRAIAKNLSFDNESFYVVWHANLTDLLIRGRYHDQSARLAGHQILHHPARDPVLAKLHGRRTQYALGNTERTFAHLLVAGSFRETSPQRRLDLWLDNVLTARRAALELPAADDDEAARRIVVDQAKRIGVRTHPKLFDDVIDATVAVGTGVLTSFVVTGWADVAISMAMYAAARSENLGTRTARTLFERKGRLNKFAGSDAGRIDRRWV